jgi:hypothetical protein
MAYDVMWIPTDAIEALADERGRPSRDESPLDYCEAEDAERGVRVKDFDRAQRIAKEKLPSDFFGCVRIEHVIAVKERPLDCIERIRYETDAVWHVSDYGDSLDPEQPHDRHEVELYDGDFIIAD